MTEEGDDKLKGVGTGEELHKRFSGGLGRGRIPGGGEEIEKVGIGDTMSGRRRKKIKAWNL
jgi:hypothetical protein